MYTYMGGGLFGVVFSYVCLVYTCTHTRADISNESLCICLCVEMRQVHYTKRKPMLQKTRKLINVGAPSCGTHFIARYFDSQRANTSQKFMRPINRFLVEITDDDRFYWDDMNLPKHNHSQYNSTAVCHNDLNDDYFID